MPRPRKSLASQQSEWIVCQTIAHDWDDNPTAELQTVFTWVMALRCTRCGVERFDYLNVRGDLMQRYYRNYPEGYKSSRTKAPLRRELIARDYLVHRTRRVPTVSVENPEETNVVQMKRRRHV